MCLFPFCSRDFRPANNPNKELFVGKLPLFIGKLPITKEPSANTSESGTLGPPQDSGTARQRETSTSARFPFRRGVFQNSTQQPPSLRISSAQESTGPTIDNLTSSEATPAREL